MTTGEQWVDEVPPPSRRYYASGFNWDEIAQELRDKADVDPSAWLLVAEGGPRSTAAMLYTGGQVRALTETSHWRYEVQTRNNDREHNTCDIYMRAVRKKRRSR